MTTHQIRLAGSDTVFPCNSGDVLLRAAQRAGLGFPYECNVGSCRNCRFELVEGEVAVAWEGAPGWTQQDRLKKRYLGCQTRPLSDCTIKLRPDPKYAALHLPRQTTAVLQRRTAITHDIAELRFMLASPMAFEPGQYALLHLPGVQGPRAYSMSNLPGDGAVWEFAVRRQPGGQGSPNLVDTLPLGSTIGIDGPYGMAWLRRDAPRDILCIAGGSGLSPMLSIARAALSDDSMAERHVHFLYGGRTVADICGENLLRELPRAAGRLAYHAAISPVAGASVEGWSGAVGYLHEVALEKFGARLPEFEIYFAGPPAMAEAVQRMLLDAKVPAQQVHFDQFY